MHTKVAVLEHLGAVLRRHGAVLGRLEAVFGRHGAVSAVMWRSWGRLGAVLGMVLGRHGAILERLGAGERTGRPACRTEEWPVHEMVLFARIWHTQ